MSVLSSASRSFLRRLAAPSLALALLLILTALSGSGSFLAWTANTGMDLLFWLRGPVPADDRIVIVGVDEASLDQYGRWPFPRRLHAELLDRLHGARAVGLDFIFAEPSPDDALLSAALTRSREARTPVILAAAPGGADAPEEMLRPHPGITGHAGLGHIESMISGDGIVRWVNPRGMDGVPALAFALARAGGGASAEGDGQDGSVRVINFAGPEASFLTLSYRDVLTGRYSAEVFKDRFVLVGAQARGLGDAYITAFTRTAPTPGVEIQANILANVLDRAFLRPLPWLPWLLIALFACLPLALWPRLGERTNLGLTLGLAALTLGGAWILFRRDLFFDFLTPLGFLLCAYLLSLLLELFHAGARILQQSRQLDEQLDERLRAAPLLPLLGPAAVPVGSRPGLRTGAGLGGLQRHLARLREVAAALSMQHHFLNTLLRDEMPPLILWESTSGRAIFANEAFRSLWRACADGEEAGEAGELPRLTGFLARMAELTGRDGDRLLRFDGNDGETTRFNVRLRLSAGLRDLRGGLRELRFPDSGRRATLALFSDITEIRELERVKDEVAAIVSHEFKQPLTVILGYGQMLLERLEVPEERRYAENICRQSERLNRMIRDFLDIASLESGRTRPRPRFFPLDRLLNEVVDSIRPLAVRKRIVVRRTAPTTVSPCLGDEALLAHALLNLLDNAVKFSPEDTTVDLRLVEEPDRFVLRVADEGPGIPPEDRERIFEKFRRGSRADKDEGFGLGLHLAQRIIEAHGGVIAALDVPKGATFEIALPKAAEGRD